MVEFSCSLCADEGLLITHPYPSEPSVGQWEREIECPDCRERNDAAVIGRYLNNPALPLLTRWRNLLAETLARLVQWLW